MRGKAYYRRRALARFSVYLGIAMFCILAWWGFIVLLVAAFDAVAR